MISAILPIHRSSFVNVFIKPFFIGSLLLMTSAGFSQKEKKAAPLPPLSNVKGKLTYVADSLGNRVPDFSYCGYMGGDKAISDAPVMVVVPVKTGDATCAFRPHSIM